MKDNLDYAATSGFLEALDYEAENMVRTAQTRDHKEAVRAFIEKRRPRFNGN
jgi:enoyl-CoA hydratase/carnithine racemase